MVKSKRSAGILWGALAALAILGFVWETVPLTDASKRLEGIPLNGTDFVSRDAPLTPTEQEAFRGVRVIKRLVRYREEPPVLLTVIDGSHNRHAVHDPWYCIQGAGWKSISEQEMSLPGGTGKWTRLRRSFEADGNANGDDNQRQIEAVYWYSDGKTRYTSPMRYWMRTAIRRLTFGASGAEPTLVIMQSVGSVAPDWEQLLPQLPILSDI